MIERERERELEIEIDCFDNQKKEGREVNILHQTPKVDSTGILNL
jgi:hypothetical protein